MINHCSIKGCERKYAARGYCLNHYKQTVYKDKHLAQQRILRNKNGNLYTRKYEKNRHGFLMRLYRNMQSRVMGVQKKKSHLYLGKEILPRQEFYEWALNSPDFNQLFAEWQNSGYDRKLTPSPDRINSELGYTLDNMEWVTHSENSRRASLNR